MSSFWEIDFSVNGKEEDIRTMLSQLESMEFSPEAIDLTNPIHVRAGKELFHGDIKVRSRGPGWVVIHTSRNYRGENAVCDLIMRFPGLYFLGSVHSEIGGGNGGEYTTFNGSDGEMYVVTHIHPNVEGVTWEPEVGITLH